MKIRDMFERGTVFSFEIFPPKKTAPIETIYNTLEELGDLKPDFISVTSVSYTHLTLPTKLEV